MNSLSVDLLPLRSLREADIEAWRALAAEALSPNPFYEPEFVLPAAAAFDVPDLSLLRVSSGSRWLAVLPIHRPRSWRGVPGQVAAAWRSDYTYLCSPLVADADRDESIACLVTGALRAAPGLAIDLIEACSPLSDTFVEILRSRAWMVEVEQFERPALVRRDPGDYLERAMGSSHRSQYRRALRRLQADVGELALHDDSHDPLAVERFLDLERSGWKGESGTRTAMACRPGHAAFFSEMCHSFRESNRLQLLALRTDTRTVAMQCDLFAGDMVFGFKSAYDEQLRRFSPGVQLHIANLPRFHEIEKSCIDSCAAAGNVSALRLWPDRRRLRSIVVARRDGAGAVTYAKWRAAVAARPALTKARVRRA